MFREMRRKVRELTFAESEQILINENYGILSVYGDDGYPYGVPLNYGYTDGKLYIHSTSESSHKLDGIRNNDKVCFTVVDKSELAKEEFSTNYRSVIVFGRARLITEHSQMVEAMMKMMSRLAPDMEDKAMEHCRHSVNAMAMIEITPEHITGKARKKKSSNRGNDESE